MLLLILAVTAACPAGAQSWVFRRSTFTHDPATGARVAQYDRINPVEELPDPRYVTSGYRQIRTTLRGPDGSIDNTYQVTRYAPPGGGLDAEWERFHDAWRESLLTGSYFYQNQPAPTGAVYGYPGGGYGPYAPGLPNGAYGDPRFASPYVSGPGSAYGPAPYGPAPYGYAPYGPAPFVPPAAP